MTLKTSRKTLRLLSLCALTLLSVLAWTAQSQAATYYVATTGHDSNDGLAPAYQSGARGPFRSLMRAALYVRPGDTVQIRGGSYYENSSWTVSGTEAAPITITNYNGETVVINGNNFSIPGGTYNSLLNIKGDWYNVSNLEIGYSSWYGLTVAGIHCVADNIFVHHSWGAGIVAAGSYGLIVNCRAYNNSQINAYYRPHEGGWGMGISACRYPQHTTIRGCTAWDNWGEGISTYESYYTTIEDCVSYNNQQNFYLSDTKYSVLRRCLSYYTPGNRIQTYETQCAILIGNEGHTPACSDLTVVNNLCLGGERNILIGSNTFENGLVAYNTFVNASNTQGSDTACVMINGGAYANARFENNIIVQDDSVPIIGLGASGVRFVSNAWSRSPVSGARSTGDVVADPQLKRAGSTDIGALTPGWFDILETSPAKDRATVLSAVNEDFRQKARGSAPDIGAFEVAGDGGTTPVEPVNDDDPPVVVTTLVANAVASPSSGRSPLTVVLAAGVGGGAPPYSYLWRFGDGSTSTSQYPSHTYTKAGIFQAVVTVTDAKNATATDKVTVTVKNKVDISQLRHDRKAAPRIVLK